MLLAAADKLTAGLLHRFATQWPLPAGGGEDFAVVRISIERVLALYQVTSWRLAAIPMENPYCSCKLTREGALHQYSKKGEEGEHYLIGKGRRRQPDFTSVIVIDGFPPRSPTSSHCVAFCTHDVLC